MDVKGDGVAEFCVERLDFNYNPINHQELSYRGLITPRKTYSTREPMPIPSSTFESLFERILKQGSNVLPAEVITNACTTLLPLVLHPLMKAMIETVEYYYNEGHYNPCVNDKNVINIIKHIKKASCM
ncbi:MAG: hypothetical protein PHN45_00820 [Methylococcales bacterium]|nr:hypothetical protein [Methylococcales bacterium]